MSTNSFEVFRSKIFWMFKKAYNNFSKCPCVLEETFISPSAWTFWTSNSQIFCKMFQIYLLVGRAGQNLWSKYRIKHLYGILPVTCSILTTENRKPSLLRSEGSISLQLLSSSQILLWIYFYIKSSRKIYYLSWNIYMNINMRIYQKMPWSDHLTFAVEIARARKHS